MSVQLVPAAGRNAKSPSDSMVTLPPSLLANVPAVTVNGPGPSTSASLARMEPFTVLCGSPATGAPSPGSLTTRVVLPTADLPAPRVSLVATGASFTSVTVIVNTSTKLRAGAPSSVVRMRTLRVASASKSSGVLTSSAEPSIWKLALSVEPLPATRR